MSDQSIEAGRFDICDVIVVVVVIGIIVALGAPRFMKGYDKAKKMEVRTVLKQIYHKEKIFFREFDQYVAVNNTVALSAGPLGFEDPAPEAQYDYSVKVRSDSFTVIATEIGDADRDGIPGEIMTIDQNGRIGGDL